MQPSTFSASHFATFAEWYKAPAPLAASPPVPAASVPMEIEDDNELDDLVALMATLSLSSDDDNDDSDIIMEDDDEEAIELDLGLEFATSMNDFVGLMANLSTPDSEMDDKDEMELDLQAEIDSMDDKDEEMAFDQPSEIDWMEVDGDWMMAVDGP